MYISFPYADYECCHFLIVFVVVSLLVFPPTDQVLHVGLVSEGNREQRNAKWGTQEKAGTAASSKAQAQVLYL